MRKLCIAALLVLLAVPAWAQNAIYQNLGTAITWTDTGGDEQLDLGDGVNGLNDAVSCGSYHDWGADPRPTRYYIEVDIDGYVGAPTIGEGFAVYVAMGETTARFTGPVTLNDTVDVAGNTGQPKNWLYIGNGTNTTATAATNVTFSTIATVSARYWAPCIHNTNVDADADFQTATDNHEIIVWPVYDEIQP